MVNMGNNRKITDNCGINYWFHNNWKLNQFNANVKKEVYPIS